MVFVRSFGTTQLEKGKLFEYILIIYKYNFSLITKLSDFILQC